jgi:hypothetical protein
MRFSEKTAKKVKDPRRSSCPTTYLAHLPKPIYEQPCSQASTNMNDLHKVQMLNLTLLALTFLKYCHPLTLSYN